MAQPVSDDEGRLLGAAGVLQRPRRLFRRMAASCRTGRNRDRLCIGVQRAAGAKIAKTAPCGSATIEKRPIFEMSCGGTITFAPSCFALSALPSTLVTMKYGIQ